MENTTIKPVSIPVEYEEVPMGTPMTEKEQRTEELQELIKKLECMIKEQQDLIRCRSEEIAEIDKALMEAYDKINKYHEYIVALESMIERLTPKSSDFGL